MLDAALDLLAERKTLSFSLAEVAERAGYSRGLPTQTFGSKVGMIRALIAHLHVRSEEAVNSPPGARGEGLAAVLTTARLMLNAPETQVQIMIAVHVLLAEATVPDSPYRQEAADLNRWAISYLSWHLRIGIEQGDVRPDINCRAQAMLIMAAIRGVLLQWLVDPARIDLDALRAEMLTSLVLLLSTAPSVSFAAARA